MKNENLIILYRDLSALGGAPNDLRNFVRHLNEQKALRSISWGHQKYSDVNNNVHHPKFRHVLYYLFRKNFRPEDKIIIAGGLIFSNIFIAILLHIRSLKFDYMPLSQWTDWSLNQKIFSEYPEIKSLKSNDVGVANTTLELKRKIKSMTLVLLKKVYFKLSRPIFRKAEIYWVSSQWEAIQICKALNIDKCTYRVYKFGCDLTLKEYPRDSYYKKFGGYTNIVYWGRVDYTNKGLDRLIEIASHAKKRLIEKKVLFHIVGPSYNNGTKSLENHIKQNNLDMLFEVASTETVKDLGIEGLANADGSILFTRFEINARVIREASYFQVPIIATEEAHIRETGGPNSAVIDFCDIKLAEKCFFEFMENNCILNSEKRICTRSTWIFLQENNLLISPPTEL